jgi:hypothetical protein
LEDLRELREAKAAEGSATTTTPPISKQKTTNQRLPCPPSVLSEQAKRRLFDRKQARTICFLQAGGPDNVFSMNKPVRSLILAVFLAACLGSTAAEPNFTPLFNGKDLTNFKAAESKEFWRVENGILIGQNNAAKKENYLWTEKEYGDFVLEFDARWQSTTKRGVDTGVEMRKPKIQLQLGVSGSLLVDMTGSFYTGGKPAYPESGQAKEAKKLLKPDGEWNTFRIRAKGDTFTCWINGQKASEYTDAKFSGAAALGLQVHGGVEMKCEYRSLKIAELGGAKAVPGAFSE